MKSSEQKTEVVDVNNEVNNKIKIKKNIRKKNKRPIKNNFITGSNNQENVNDLENSDNNNNNNKIDSAQQITQNNKEESSTQKIEIMEIIENGLDRKNISVDKKLLELKDFEINSLEYEEAIKLDKRNFYEDYISLLRYNHPFMFSFAPSMDYNSFIIKKFLFFFSFSLDFTINTLFFSDDTMHKIYEDKGKFNFLYQIPQILYSTIISRIIDSIIRTLALSQDNIIELKQEKEKKDLDMKYKKLLQRLKIKFILFFVIAFTVLGVFWYYITCFCGIYINTQIHLIKDSVLSFVTGLLYPFGLYLIPGIFRISALKAEKHDGKCMYKFSSFIESYLC